MDDVYIDMLEAAFPYISQNLKRPVASILKFQELQKVLHDYDTEEMISACSLDSSKINIEQMLTAMKARATPEIAKQIDTLLNTMKMLRVYQSYQDIMNSMPSSASSSDIPENKAENSSSSNDMLSTLLNDLIQKNNRGES